MDFIIGNWSRRADQQGRQGDHRHEGQLAAGRGRGQEDGAAEGDEQHAGAEAQPGAAGLGQGGHQVRARGPAHLRPGQRLQLEGQAEGNSQLRGEAGHRQRPAGGDQQARPPRGGQPRPRPRHHLHPHHLPQAGQCGGGRAAAGQGEDLQVHHSQGE